MPYYDPKSNVYESASPSVIFPAVCPHPLSPLGQQQAASIASDIRYLYDHYHQIRKVFAKHQFSFSHLFIALLRKRGLATDGGSLRLKDFTDQFDAFFDADLMMQLGVPFDQTVKKPWMVSMCRHTKKSFHPLRYILMARFLCHGLPNLVQLAEEASVEDLILPHTVYGCVEDMDIKLEKYRTQWLQACNAMPEAGRNEVRKTAESTYTWLLRHDKMWLMEHCNEKRPTGGTKTFADMKEKDLLYVSKVHVAAEEIRCAPGKPIWITKTRLAKQLGLLPRLLPDLPMTQKAFEQEVESQMDFRLRKIAWAESELTAHGKPATRWQILKLAAIRDNDWDKCWNVYISTYGKTGDEEHDEIRIAQRFACRGTTRCTWCPVTFGSGSYHPSRFLRPWRSRIEILPSISTS